MKFIKQTYLPFIRSLIIIALPIILQQLFLNIASLLDTMMVGQLDEASVSGVYVANQIIFVINLLIFGATEGGSVYFCQFFGINDERNMRKCFVFKLAFSMIFAALAILLVDIFAPQLVNLFIQGEEEVDIAVTYLRLLSISFIPYAITSSISTCLRECHKATSPMVATGTGAVLNFIINYLFIFGKLSLPALGAVGAAIGTITERYFEMILLIVYIYIKKFPFSKHLFHHLKMEPSLLKKLTLRSFPLIGNELLWALGQTVLVYIFTQNDPIATVALPIATTCYNLIFVICQGMGQSYTILVGNTLGKGDEKEAQKEAYMCLSFSLIIGAILCLILLGLSTPVASLYTGVSEEAREMGAYLIRIYGIYIIVCSMTGACFFILRSGGKTTVVFFFDSGYTWILQIPLAFLLLYTTKMEFSWFVPVVYGIDLVKIAIGLVLIISRKWIKTLTEKEQTENKLEEKEI